MRLYFGRKRHVHDKEPKTIRKIVNDEWVQECSCGRRRIERIGWGTESGIYYSRWYDSEEISKLRRLFPEQFNNE